MRIKPILQAAVFGGAMAACGLAFGQASGSNTALLDILVKKGILTQDEAAQLQQEAAASSAAPTAPAASAAPASGAAVPAGAVTAASAGDSPLFFNIGAAKFTPVGFLDMTGVYRNTNAGGAIGTSFGSLPLSNSTQGQLSETKFSAQNSRLGMKVESKVGDVNVLGYVETDFLGNAANNINETSNSDTLRMRVYFADLRDGDWEFLAGQDWSLLTPNRRGISPMPSDIFYSMDMDTNYQAGLTWARQAQIRLTYHPTDEFALALSAENPDQYVTQTLGTGLLANVGTAQVDSGSGSSGAGTAAPSELPDFIAKAAYDTKVNDLAWHFEASGLLSEYKINTFNAGAGLNSDSSATGSGVELATDLELMKGLSFIATGFKSNGDGRYIGSVSAPDFVVVPGATATTPASISTVRSESAILGLEWQALANSQLFGYWSAVQIDQAGETLGGTNYGYGLPGEGSNSKIHEYTLGEVQTFWKSPKYGALQTITQVSYADRDLWSVTSGPTSGHSSMVFVDLRYVLP